MDDWDPFQAIPELGRWRDQIENAENEFKHRIEHARSGRPDDAPLIVLNAVIAQMMAIAEANEAIGVTPDRATLRALILENLPFGDSILARHRALAVSIAYANSMRLERSGSKDSRMQAALAMAAELEGLGGDDPAETIRKSLQRLRKALRNDNSYRLDTNSLQFERVDAEEFFMPGLPKNPGRPRKERKSQD